MAHNRLARASGVLLHPTSLPGPHGIGDLGEQSYRFVDYLCAAEQRIWQVLPLGPTGPDHCPYSACSAFAGNPLLLSLHKLREDGLLDSADLAGAAEEPAGRAAFGAAWTLKFPRLRRAFQRFTARGGPEAAEFAAFCAASRDWLDDYCLFMAVKEATGGRPWPSWPAELARRTPAALGDARARLRDDIGFHRFLQYQFHRQWSALRCYATAAGIRLVGDIPLFVAADSADVWARRDQFLLDGAGRPTYVAGAPPDYYSATGQVWGAPLYDWSRQAADGFGWWVDRMRTVLRHVDVVRIDHFRGFHACWALPPDARTGLHGEWMAGPGAALFEALTGELGPLPVLVEDLGLIPPEVDALRDRLGFPAMRLVQWGFLDSAAFHDEQALRPDLIDRHLPHNYGRGCVAYTSTHDTDPIAGWYAGLNAYERGRVHRCLGHTTGDVGRDLLRLVQSSAADTVIIPLQDVLGLGSEARMNVPGSARDNWLWRVTAEQLTPEHAGALAGLTRTSGRAGPTAPGRSRDSGPR